MDTLSGRTLGGASLIEKRRWPRRPVNQPSGMHFVEGSVTGTLLDLSEGGALVQVPVRERGIDLRKGDVFQVDIPDHGTEPVTVERVDDDRIGVSFFCPK